MHYETLDPDEAHGRIAADSKWTFLDVRTEREFQAGHASGAFNVPYAFRELTGMTQNPSFVDVVQRRFAPDSHLVLGCAAGARSQRACELLAAAGFRNLVNMDGGFSGRRDESGQVVVEGWQARGLPTEADAPVERTYPHLASESRSC